MTFVWHVTSLWGVSFQTQDPWLHRALSIVSWAQKCTFVEQKRVLKPTVGNE